MNITEQSMLKILERMDPLERASFLQAYIQQIGPLTDEAGELAKKIMKGEKVEL